MIYGLILSRTIKIGLIVSFTIANLAILPLYEFYVCIRLQNAKYQIYDDLWFYLMDKIDVYCIIFRCKSGCSTAALLFSDAPFIRNWFFIFSVLF